MLDLETKEWATDLLLDAQFGHRTRADRCTQMLRCMMERPFGRISEVFVDPADREGAYRFVEGVVRPKALVETFAAATLREQRDEPFLFVVVDGTSLSITDRAKKKGFGSIGARAFPTRGLKVIDAIGLDADGTPRGLLDLEFWARGPAAIASQRARRIRGCTETQHWVTVIDRVADRARNAGVVPWFVIDREGDAATILRAVDRSEGFFTVRVSQRDRTCVDELAGRRSVGKAIGRQPIIGTHVVDVPRGHKRRARRAVLDVRIGRITLDLHEHGARRAPMDTFVVWARERKAPRGAEPLDWMLFTNHPVHSLKNAKQILVGYCHRWRVEDFHRTWKRGRCNVEDTQLRKRDHVVRWATMHAAVAMRVERLKFLARTSPGEPATIALSPLEVDALREAKRTQFCKRTENIGDEMPTIATAVLWIAQFGGFIGKSSDRAGSITIGRGLERLLVHTRGFAAGLKAARERG